MSAHCHPFEFELRRSAMGEVVELSDAFALHLDRCPACRQMFDRAAVPLDSRGFESLNPLTRERLLRLQVTARRSHRRLLAAAAAAAVAVTLGGAGLAVLRTFSPAPPSVAVALVEDHIRYLTEADRWSTQSLEELLHELTAYVDFPVSLPTAGPAELTGARRCYLLGRRAVLAFYQEGRASLSYFVLPAGGVALPREDCGDDGFRCTAQHGFVVVTWERTGLLHGVVGAASRQLAN
jgi:hypothetical protein